MDKDGGKGREKRMVGERNYGGREGQKGGGRMRGRREVKR